ncbi:hypothetical protein LSH36_40g13048 [Paralvinella palmiformis]|uniref:Ig-like domain-containing protein n=1 Tax=Paralvinella palmiformis TaxID=53620 RepID=A0AAD9K7V7_9ANNE|nr:hypothetical protein LSH36_40g13048 [Paralvinella palmiformis]
MININLFLLLLCARITSDTESEPKVVNGQIIDGLRASHITVTPDEKRTIYCPSKDSEWSYGFTNSYVPHKLSQHQTMNLDDGPLHVLNISLQNLTFSLDTSTEVIFVCKERNLPNTNRVFRVKCKSTRSRPKYVQYVLPDINQTCCLVTGKQLSLTCHAEEAIWYRNETHFGNGTELVVSQSGYYQCIVPSRGIPIVAVYVPSGYPQGESTEATFCHYRDMNGIADNKDAHDESL